ncbi:hypothetical protein ACUX4R_27060 [Salmonella enterica]
MENIDLTAENEAELDFNNFNIHELAQQLEDTNTKYHLARIIAKALLSRRLNEYDLEK